MTYFTLASEWLADRVRLTLSITGSAAVTGFRLALGGPARIDLAHHSLVNARIASQISTYVELAPPEGFVLVAGSPWVVDIIGFADAMKHWTDAAAAAFVILADGSAELAAISPIMRAGSAPYRRGTMQLDGTPPSIAIIPWPSAVDVNGARSTPTGFTIDASVAPGALAAFRHLVTALFADEQLIDDANGIPVALVADTGLAVEAYRLSFGETIRVEASTDTGFLYGLISLGQMLRGARSASALTIPASGTIEDAPANGFRGCHLDVARRFYPVDDIRRFLAILAWNKLNRFHWHLSDDEAWRVEIDAYPQLTEIGAWRGHGLPLEPFLGTGPARTGGFYTKKEIREIIALAASYGIEVIPEIDIPGHCHAMLVALPHLRDPDETGAYYSIQAFPNNCLNPGIEAVHEALETILAEMLALFPSRWFHVGADEVPKDAWSHSPAAARLAADLRTNGSAPLQAHFLRRIQSFLTANGKITGAWEEAAHGGGVDAGHSYLVGWTRTEISRQLAAEGYDVVVAPGQAYYLDMANTPEWHEPGSYWAGWSSPEATYAYEPTGGWTATEAARFKGVQACIWSEPMIGPEIFDRLVFPRLSAIAETGWTASARKDFARFAALSNLMPTLYGHREEHTK